MLCDAEDVLPLIETGDLLAHAPERADGDTMSGDAMSYELDWNVAVYCQNEEKRLQGCLERVIAALTGRRALITVILNGSSGSQPRDRAARRARRWANRDFSNWLR